MLTKKSKVSVKKISYSFEQWLNGFCNYEEFDFIADDYNDDYYSKKIIALFIFSICKKTRKCFYISIL